MMFIRIRARETSNENNYHANNRHESTSWVLILAKKQKNLKEKFLLQNLSYAPQIYKLSFDPLAHNLHLRGFVISITSSCNFLVNFTLL